MIEAILTASGKTIEKVTEGGRVKISQRKNKKNPIEWWDKECEKIIKNRREALTKVRKDLRILTWIECKKNRAIVRKVIKRKKVIL